MHHAPFDSMAREKLPVLEMPTSTGGMSAQTLHDWVHWAALPKVDELKPDRESAATYLRDGSVGILFVGSASGEATSAARQMLRVLAHRLISEGLHGMTLLHASKAEPGHRQLREKLGLAAAINETDEFCIVRLAGSRFAETHMLQQVQETTGGGRDADWDTEVFHSCAHFLRGGSGSSGRWLLDVAATHWRAIWSSASDSADGDSGAAPMIPPVGLCIVAVLSMLWCWCQRWVVSSPVHEKTV